MEQVGRSEAGGLLGAFAAPAGALPVLVLERAEPEPVWDELLLEPSPPRPVVFVPLLQADALEWPVEAARSPSGDLVVAASGSSAGAALAMAAAVDRVVALLLVDPVAAPVDLRADVVVLVVRSGSTCTDGLPLPEGADRPAAVARIRAALAAPPFAPSSA
jgi:hypothetical protein